MDELEEYMIKVTRYRDACGKLRERLSQAMDIIYDDDISSDEKVNILKAEMQILADDETVSYEALGLYDNYEWAIDHSDEYLNLIASREKGRSR